MNAAEQAGQTAATAAAPTESEIAATYKLAIIHAKRRTRGRPALFEEAQDAATDGVMWSLKNFDPARAGVGSFESFALAAVRRFVHRRICQAAARFHNRPVIGLAHEGLPAPERKCHDLGRDFTCRTWCRNCRKTCGRWSVLLCGSVPVAWHCPVDRHQFRDGTRPAPRGGAASRLRTASTLAAHGFATASAVKATPRYLEHLEPLRSVGAVFSWSSQGTKNAKRRGREGDSMHAMTTTDPTEPPRVLDTSDVCELVRCSPPHLRALVKRGEFPAPFRLGHLVRWDRETVLRFIAEGGRTVERGGRLVETR
ncbi:MAG: helix-turn-helix domain-containing protein [Gemmataceae bacterium]